MCTRGLNLALLSVRDLQESKTSACSISHEVFSSGQFNNGAKQNIAKVSICTKNCGVTSF